MALPKQVHTSPTTTATNQVNPTKKSNINRVAFFTTANNYFKPYLVQGNMEEGKNMKAEKGKANNLFYFVEKGCEKFVTPFLFILFLFMSWAGFSQLQKQVSIENNEQIKKAVLQLNADAGKCYIQASKKSQELLSIYSPQHADESPHRVHQQIEQGQAHVEIELFPIESNRMAHTVSNQVLHQRNNSHDDMWQIFLNETTPYFLDFQFGLDDAIVNLSGITVKRCKIETGSGNLVINNSPVLYNKTEMDTFLIRADMGNIHINKANLAKAKVVIAEVSFGNMYLDVSDVPQMTHKIQGNVGAGNLYIILPKNNQVPIKAVIHDSWLCHIGLVQDLKPIADNVYINAAYQASPQNALVFDIDVSVGKVTFSRK